MAQERLRLFRRRGVETVILAGADTHGIMRGKRVPIDHCVAMRRGELGAQAAAVTDWETARYLEAL